MFPHILDKTQEALLPLIKEFKKEFYLVGGTAIALQMGHRKSIDFDLFKFGQFDSSKIKNRIKKYNFTINQEYRRSNDDYTLMVEGVKCTFFNYPFEINANLKFESYLRMPELIQLAAMKAYTLGRRGTWKDYTDLFFLIKKHFSLKEIIEEAKRIFKEEFNEKLFSEQLCYFEDVWGFDLVEFIIDPPPTQQEIQTFLTEVALQ